MIVEDPVFPTLGEVIEIHRNGILAENHRTERYQSVSDLSS